MLTNLDKFGRIVIPNAIREELGLKPGDSLEVSWTGTEINLKPASVASPLMVREGILIYETKAEEAIDKSVIEDDRAQRLRRILESDKT